MLAEITSMTLILLNTFFKKFLLFNSHIPSEVHTVTPKAPTRLPIILITKDIRSVTIYAKNMPTNNNTLMTMIVVFVI